MQATINDRNGKEIVVVVNTREPNAAEKILAIRDGLRAKEMEKRKEGEDASEYIAAGDCLLRWAVNLATLNAAPAQDEEQS